MAPDSVLPAPTNEPGRRTQASLRTTPDWLNRVLTTWCTSPGVPVTSTYSQPASIRRMVSATMTSSNDGSRQVSAIRVSSTADTSSSVVCGISSSRIAIRMSSLSRPCSGIWVMNGSRIKGMSG